MRRINQLIEIMEVQRDDVARRVVVRKSRNVGLAIPHPIEDRDLPLLRHPLSQYRKSEKLASINLKQR
jgi:hypothetical protein